MLKISFTNAEVSDHGYGLEVNGKSLEDIISTALGTKLKGNGGYGSGLPSFNSNSCDVTVIINPHKETRPLRIRESRSQMYLAFELARFNKNIEKAREEAEK